jgi:hypothetical protein
MEAADFFNLDLRRLKIKPGPTTHYLQFFYAGHPLAGQNGMANFARYLASQKLGRWLTPNEVAVHADDNRGNCAPGNLLVFSRAESARRSLPSHQVERVLLACTLPECGQEYTKVPSPVSRHRYCSPVGAQLASRKFQVTPVEMQQMVWELPTTQIALAYGVSDKAIEKFCKKHQIQKPGRGYWARLYAGQPAPDLRLR